MTSQGTANPVFVLCGARSGSTLLRFILDAHPELACPPETNVPGLCGMLATVWSLIAGAPLSQNRGDEPPEIPDAAIAGVRETMDRMVGSYLERRGKKRYCDKSLGTARFGYLMTRIWPEAKFICLYRHPMDVIASGIEACPWGLNGYGFEPYIAETPFNAVFALARFWGDTAGVILQAEQEYADRCLRVRYEDMVADPQATADEVFKFLDIEPVPDIAERCFAPERERFGPADYKIWHTSAIHDASVGRGWTVPAGLIAVPARLRLNELCQALGYVPVDENWGTADPPADIRADVTGSVPIPEPEADSAVEHAAIGTTLAERLADGLVRLNGEIGRRWVPCAEDRFEVVVTRPTAAAPVVDTRWLVDIPSAQVAETEDEAESEESEEEAEGWEIIGSAATWEQVLDGTLNLSVALRSNKLRYCDGSNAGPVTAEARLSMLSDLLGLTSWGLVQRTDRPRAAAAQA